MYQHISGTDVFSEYKRLVCLGALCCEFTRRELQPEIKKQIVSFVMSYFELDEEGFLLLMSEVRDLQIDVEQFTKSLF